MNARPRAGQIVRLIARRVLPRRLWIYLMELTAVHATLGTIAVVREVYERISFWRPVRTMNYKGFELFYGRGNLILYRVRDGRTWEPEIAGRIADELARRTDRVFVDAGANLGLMTLNVLAALPDARVFAFEPGIHQYALLAQTIAGNHLENRVACYQVALGATAGTRQFAVHATRYNALDGFVDTKRAALKEIISVEQQTLDEWWRAAGCPPVGVIKIDTEGAELWVLQGAVELLTRRQPVFFLEIQRANLSAYPYGAADVLLWLHAHQYRVEGMDGTEVTTLNLARLLESQENFVARPAGVPAADSTRM